MDSAWRKKAGLLFLTAVLAMGPAPVTPALAATDHIEVILSDVTADSRDTLRGEAKIKVSVRGAGGRISAAQTALKFDGELKYKSIEFLQGKNDPPECFWIPPNAALVNSTKTLLPGIVTNQAGSLTFTDETTDLFILTFVGEPGESVTLSLDGGSAAGSYCAVDGKTISPSDYQAAASAAASSESNEGINASVKLTMDRVQDFTVADSGSYADSKITLTITNEKTGMTISTVLNPVLISKGGHYDGTKTVPTFVVNNAVLDGNTYTVELSGVGYVAYKKTGVDFKDVLELTNADFRPGDINSDGMVNEADKKLFEEIKNGAYNEYADFNRDGRVDDYDDVFEDIDDNNNENNDNNTGGGSTGGGFTGGGFTGSGGSTGGGTAAPVQSTEAFTDLENYDWAKDAIYTLKNKGIISGISETEYAPANNIKRGDLILILTRMLGINDEFAENFADVPADSYYYHAIGSAKAAGIAAGDGVNFMPENSITRQDLITLAYRAFLNAGYIEEAADASSLDEFADKAEISDYALASMASMVKAGIIQGSDGKVNPKGNATRAEVAVMCARLTELMN